MKHYLSASLVALAVGAAAVPGGAQDGGTPGGFRLPTNPTPTPTDVQGPVDPDAPILTRPRAPTPTPTPRPTATPAPPPEPLPSPTPTPRVVSPPRGSSLPPRFTPPASPTPLESEAVIDGAAPFPGTTAESEALPLPTGSVDAPPPPSSTLDNAGESENDGLPGWLVALAGLLLAAGVGAVVWMRRRSVADAVEAPQIVPPRPASPADLSGADTASPAARVGPSPLALVIDAQAKQLARSMRFATLSYELRITNRGAMPLENVTFGGDLVTAHARVPAQAQLADPSVPLAPVQTVERLDPGQSIAFSGEFRLPVEEIRPIPHGKAVVYVPLLRVRAEAEGAQPVARTFVVGLRPPGAQRLQPFRLDEMPQVYHAVGQTALD
ncbi:hypothetical protein [Tsuneonella sp. SYSU-LHT278]|uniref:hypothetical protein n=1 Tax=Tsuneonella sediminis TaxID=3416089 RepID=UPI003F7A7FD5